LVFLLTLLFRKVGRDPLEDLISPNIPNDSESEHEEHEDEHEDSHDNENDNDDQDENNADEIESLSESDSPPIRSSEQYTTNCDME
jgi:hypothetical protein